MHRQQAGAPVRALLLEWYRDIQNLVSAEKLSRRF
jgi:hypothetical protein